MVKNTIAKGSIGKKALCCLMVPESLLWLGRYDTARKSRATEAASLIFQPHGEQLEKSNRKWVRLYGLKVHPK